MKSQKLSLLGEEIEAEWERISSQGYTKVVSWIESAVKEYYSEFIKSKRAVNKITKNFITNLDHILSYIAKNSDEESLTEFFNNLILTIIAFKKKKKKVSPEELSFLATVQMFLMPGDNLNYIS